MDPLRFAPAVQPEPMVTGRVGGEADVLQTLRHLGDRGFIRFHPALAQRFGHKAALLLGLALYWTRHTLVHQPRRNGWFYMTARQWQQAVGLSDREQGTARAALVRDGLLQESLGGRPAMLHFRLDLAKVVSAILGHDVTTVPPEAEAEAHPLWSGNCVCYYKPLADLTGNVACGLYLSHLLQLQRKAVLSQQVRTDALRVSQDDVGIALCLGPKVQRNARERLRQAGLIRETGPTLVVLNLSAIMACLQAQDGRLLPRGRKSVTPSPMLSLVQSMTCDSAAGQIGVGAPRQGQNAPLSGAFAQRPLDLPSIARPTLASGSNLGQGFSVGHSSALRASLAGARSLPSVISPLVTPASEAKAGAIAARSPAEQDRAPNNLPRTTAVAENAKLGRSAVAESAELKLPKTQTHISIGISNTTTTHARMQAASSFVESGTPRRRRSIFFEPPLRATPLAKPAEAPQPVADSNLDALIYPERLEPAYLPGVRSVLIKAPAGHRQDLLDELAGQLHTQGKTIHNPAGWLMGLIRQHHEGGTLVLAMARKVAADREHRLRVQAEVERARQAHATAVPTAEPAKVADPAVMAAARERLRALRAEFMLKRG